MSISPVAQESVPVSMWKRLCGMYGGCKGIIFIAKSLPSDIQFLPQRSLDVLNFFAVGERSRNSNSSRHFEEFWRSINTTIELSPAST